MLQRNIKWSDFRMLIVNDGYDIELPEEFAGGWPWEIRQIWIEHGGISRARNAGMDASDADWIMFCDSDDAFLTTVSLAMFLKFADRTDTGMVTSGFYEEALQPDGRMAFLRHDGKDYIFVHGKMFKRQWLVDNHVRFCDKLTLHEDSYFVAMANMLLGKNNKINLPEYLYLWQWNNKSVTRVNGCDFTLKTYNHLCIKNAALADELIRRGMFVDAKALILRATTDAYANLGRLSWNTQENIMQAERAEKDIASFIRRYDYILKSIPEDQIEQSIEKTRSWLVKRKDYDRDAPRMTFQEWIERARHEIEPSRLVY